MSHSTPKRLLAQSTPNAKHPRMKRFLLSSLLGLTLSAVAFAGGTITWPTPPLPANGNKAATARAPISGWLDYFELNLQRARKMEKVDLIFDGDQLAITSGHYGPTGGMWSRFNRIKALDFSSPGDPTQAVLWRLQNGQLDTLHPKLIVLQVGSSNIGFNLGANTPEQIAEGVKAIVAEYQKRAPEATILLLGIMPRGEKPTDPARAKVKAINQIISGLGDGKKVIYLDFGDKLLEPDGTITKAVVGDFVHPGPKGYQIWADAIQPTIDQFFPPATLPPAPTPAPAVVSATNATATPEKIIGGGTITWPAPSSAAGANSAIIPAPQMSWLTRFQKNIDDSHAMPKVDLIFDGDSITDGWRGGAGGLWNKHYAKLNAFDFGISGNTTGDVIWRVQNGQVDGLHPKLVVLLIGTNNMYSCSVEEIAGGVVAGVNEYRKHVPDAAVLVLGILPRGNKADDPLRAKVKAINQIVAKCADGKKIFYVDFGEKLLTADGTYGPPMTGDFLHPSLPGYEVWIEASQPIIDQFFPPVSTPAASAATPVAPSTPAR